MMSISSSTKKYFTKVFPYSTLTAAPGKLTYAAIEQTQRKIFACASSIESLRGGGQHGKLGLVTTPSAYDLVAPETPYIRPIHPGDPPTYDGMTQREIHANEGQLQTVTNQLLSEPLQTVTKSYKQLQNTYCINRYKSLHYQSYTTV